MTWELSQGARSAVEGSSGYREVARDLGRCLSTFRDSAGVAHVAVSDDPRATAQILAGRGALGDGVDHALPLDFAFHLPERRHDREQHGPHRCRCVDVAAHRIQHPEACAAAAEFLSESEHVLRPSTQPNQSSDDERIAVLEGIEGIERSVEVWSSRSSTGDTVVDIEVVEPDASGEKIDLLPIGGLLARGYARMADQLRHSAPVVPHN